MLQENRGYAEVGGFLPQYSADFEYGLGPDTLLQNAPHIESDVGEKPKILLMGLRRSGKSSIQKVVFHKMAPNETLFLESTHKIEKNDVSECSFIKFQIWDFPGHVNFCDEMFRSDEIFLASCAIIFIVDAQDDYHEALCYLHTTLETAFRHNTNIKFEVFIHKVDCLNDDQKIDIQRDITQRVTNAVEDLLSEHGAAGGISIGFHLTTIYDHSIFEAFSKVVQKLIPHLDAFEHLLNIFIAVSCLDFFLAPFHFYGSPNLRDCTVCFITTAAPHSLIVKHGDHSSVFGVVDSIFHGNLCFSRYFKSDFSLYIVRLKIFL
ncbi:Ras GTP-binding protein C [Fasciolopsis buskii]|uniref:Ras GTP-binding protein C n=1 Tax=Fasciolopsis buskii TaxID=27845 RepID=A0A8E0RJN2_9TREM|nr:Ras GTP-binding protein C [Fasciolopsis buski]